MRGGNPENIRTSQLSAQRKIQGLNNLKNRLIMETVYRVYRYRYR